MKNMLSMKKVALVPLVIGMFFGAVGMAGSTEIDYGEIVTLLPRDAIPAILDPKHLSASAAIGHINDSDRVLGVSINGESRAYPISTLSAHEIANDFVGGVKIAITW